MATLSTRLSPAQWKGMNTGSARRIPEVEPVKDPGVQIEVVGPEQAQVFAAVQRAAFDGSRFTDERWHAMATSPLVSHAVAGRQESPGARAWPGSAPVRS
ncbi:hypothetical protein CD790_22565 [Streptomyces sp. SAJ15]|nr:hypothetical protein CD790_22565 [Streptomyces sp. SAJ15]